MDTETSEMEVETDNKNSGATTEDEVDFENKELKSRIEKFQSIPDHPNNDVVNIQCTSLEDTDKQSTSNELKSTCGSSPKAQSLPDNPSNHTDDIQSSSVEDTDTPELEGICKSDDMNSTRECNPKTPQSLPDNLSDETENIQTSSLMNLDVSGFKKSCKTVDLNSGNEINLNDSQSLHEGVDNIEGTSSNSEFNNEADTAKVEPLLELRQNHKVKLYAEDKGPKFYPVKGNIVTPPIITKNLSEAFKFLPVFGTPKNTSELEQFQNAKVREFVGCDLSDEEFSKLSKFCSSEYLRTGNELVLSNRFPTQEPLSDQILRSLEINDVSDSLCLVKKLKLRIDKDTRLVYMKKLKYRGLKILPLPQNEDYKISLSPLEPGKDLIFRVRVYRPFFCSGKDRNNTRHSVFSNDIVLLGRQKLSALRERLACANDVSMRVDVSQSPDDLPAATAKELFPSGFLFINNAFYVDTREGCKDYSAPIREWARARGLGDYPRHDMAQVSIDQLLVKLGHPEVYVHQGNCEHLFTFSEVRLLNATDPLRQSVYPFHTAISQNQTIYCTTCAEFGAKWIVTDCPRVPFDPAFFCDTCFRLYLYKDGTRICEFKAYCYRGNEINLLKPVG